MANDQVAEVKGKVDIVEIIGSRVNLKKAGRHFKGLCPFHSEKSPSFIVSPERQSYKCFGCGEGGDVLSFMQKYEGQSFLEALEELATRVGVELVTYRPTAADSERKRILELLGKANEYYHYLLTQHERGEVARSYLARRGVRSESIKQFCLGYAPSQWRSVSDYLINKKHYKLQELELAGLVIVTESGHYDRFRGRVMFPLRDHKGVVVGFSGRTLSSDKNEAKYINSPETGVYHKSKMLYGLYENRSAIRKADRVVLVEGELDVIPSVQAGVSECVAIKGSAFTVEQAQILSRYSRNVVMSLDADTAGQEAIKRAVQIAENIDLSIRVVQITGSKDPGDVASENPQAWREMVKNSVLYWDFLIESSAKTYDPSSGTGAEMITREVVPALSQITNRVVQAHYVGKLAKLLKVGEGVIYEEMKRIAKKKELNYLRSTVASLEQGPPRRQEELASYALAIGMQHYDKIAEELREVGTDWVSSRAVAQILQRLKTLEGKKLEIKSFAAQLPPELLPTLDTAYLRDLSMVEDIRREWAKVKRELEEGYVREELKMLTARIAAVGAESREMQELKERFGSLSRRLAELSK